MAVYYCDSRAIIKRYVRETGTDYIERLADLKSGNAIFLARITRVEVTAAIARRLRGKSITTGDAQVALATFQHDLTNTYLTVEINAELLSAAMSLAAKHALRGYDAVQLSAALKANDENIAVGLSPLTLISADIELNTAAQAEGLQVEDPNNHP